MKGLKNKLIGAMTTVSTAIMLLPMQAYANSDSMQKIADPIVSLIKNLLRPTLAIVGALGSLYCIILGVKFAKAEEPQEREKAKSHLKNAIIGFVLIFVLLVVLNSAMEPLIGWVTQNTKNSGL